MYLPLGVDLLKTWGIPRIQPDRRVAPPASEEARKIKRGIIRSHLKSLSRYEVELFQRLGRDAAEAIYNKTGLPVPDEAKDEEAKENNKDTASAIGTMRNHDADYKTIQLARSKFHPVKTVREQAAANLVLVEQQEIEEWQKNSASWGNPTTYCDITDAEEAYMTDWTNYNPLDSPYEDLDTDSEWSDEEEKGDNDDEHAQWEESMVSGNETEDQQVASSEYNVDANVKPSSCVTCDLLLGLPTPPPSETSSSPSSHGFDKHEFRPITAYSNTDQKNPVERYSHSTEELALVLNDKMILTTYLSKIEEGIKEARRTKAEKDADREKACRLYLGPTKRPGQAKGRDRRREREEDQDPAEEEMPLRWFEYEDMHIYNELSGQWELTVERRGRNYRLARASNTETLGHTKENNEDLAVKNHLQDWRITDAVPDWADATGTGWFD